MLANMKTVSTMLKMAHVGYTMHSEQASTVVTTLTADAPVGMVLIWGTVYVPYFVAWSLSHSPIWPLGYADERKKT